MALFLPYRATPGAVYAAAETIETTVKPIRSLRGAVLSRHAQAVAHTTGSLQPPLSSADHQTVQTAQAVCQGASFAAGCTRAWGDAITTYNTGIDGLNRRYEEAEASHFGQSAPGLFDYLTHGKMDDFAHDYVVYQQHVASAKAALVAQLRREEQQLHGDLDDEATKISGMLRAGPTQANVLALVRAGAMPLGVVDIFPGIDFRARFTDMPEPTYLPARRAHGRRGRGGRSLASG